MNQEDFEKAALMMQLSTFVMKSAIAFLIPDGTTLAELGFYGVLATSIDDESIKNAIDTPEKHATFKEACLKVAEDLNNIIVKDSANA
jgi:hypothetical protein